MGRKIDISYYDQCNTCSKRNCHKKANPNCGSYVKHQEGFKIEDLIPAEQVEIVRAIALNRRKK